MTGSIWDDRRRREFGRAIYEAAETLYVEVDREMPPVSPGNEVRGRIGNDFRDAIEISIAALDDTPQDHAGSDA